MTERHGQRLLLSIHDVGPRFEGEVDRLRDALLRHAPADRVALLVVPDHWGAAPIVPGSAFATRLRGWADCGVEMFVHGWLHRDDAAHAGGWAKWRARRMTAGEGEFSGLARSEALRRMRAGAALLSDVTGRAPSGFIAPAWLYSQDALIALIDAGFPIAEDHWHAWDPRSGRTIARGPVLTWASRSRSRVVASLVAARALAPVLRRLPVARVGVHPGDTGVPALMRSIDRNVATLAATHRPARYSDLLAA